MAHKKLSSATRTLPWSGKNNLILFGIVKKYIIFVQHFTIMKPVAKLIFVPMTIMLLLVLIAYSFNHINPWIAFGVAFILYYVFFNNFNKIRDWMVAEPKLKKKRKSSK